MRFAQALKEPTFAPREARAGKDARTFARDILAMTQEEFSATFRGSPMKRAKRRGLARNAAVVLGNVGTAEDIPVLEGALEHDEPLVREHAGWALRRLDRDHDCARRPRERPAQGTDDRRGERHRARGMATCVYVPSAPRLRRAKTAYRTGTRRSIVTQAGHAFVARMLDPASRPAAARETAAPPTP